MRRKEGKISMKNMQKGWRIRVLEGKNYRATAFLPRFSVLSFFKDLKLLGVESSI